MALGDLVAANVQTQGSLKKLIKLSLREDRAVGWLDEKSYLRVSSLSGMCAREEVLAALYKVPRRDLQETDLKLIFAHGTGLHYALQNVVLGGIGVLLGIWHCVDCATPYGSLEGDVGTSQTLVRKPGKCEKCGCTDFLYREQHFINEEFRIGGHPDGFAALPGMAGLGILEFKSISTKRAWEVKDTPELGHAIQAHAYMWLTGLKWAKILYWDKGGFGLSALIEHTIERDEETVDSIKSLIRSVWNGIASGIYPARICDTVACPRAKKCSLVDKCFEDQP